MVSIPATLVKEVEQSNDLLITPTEVIYGDGSTIAGLAAGASLTLPGTGRYQIYLIFPLTQEVATLGVLRYAVVTTGAILVILLTFIAALVSRQVVAPIRAARRAAESIASGNLHDRMQVRGRDDLARLATSMNYMASELEKQITTLEELSAVQQRFVSDVSHELRTPLTTVRMAAEVLHEAREDFDAVAARSAELMQTELDRFEALLTDLLEISRFDAGAAVLTVDEVDIRDVVDRVVEASSRLAETYHCEILVHPAGSATAEVDARRIERILRNLLVNAIEHSEGNPIDILIESDDAAVAVAVRDHGIGFEANQAKQVFHRFWRADPSRARTVGGTGLGLAIAMEDANLHGGWLTAWGRPDMGAQFRLTLPRKAGRHPGDVAAAAGPPRRGCDPGGTTRPPGPGRSSRWAGIIGGRHAASTPSSRPGRASRQWVPDEGDDEGAAGLADRPGGRRPGLDRLCHRADVRPGRADRRAAAGLPELRERRGRATRARQRPGPDRRGLSSRHVQLPARLHRGEAVPDQVGPGEVESRGRCLGLPAIVPGRLRERGAADRDPGRVAGPGPHLHGARSEPPGDIPVGQ